MGRITINMCSNHVCIWHGLQRGACSWLPSFRDQRKCGVTLPPDAVTFGIQVQLILNVNVRLGQASVRHEREDIDELQAVSTTVAWMSRSAFHLLDLVQRFGLGALEMYARRASGKPPGAWSRARRNTINQLRLLAAVEIISPGRYHLSRLVGDDNRSAKLTASASSDPPKPR